MLKISVQNKQLKSLKKELLDSKESIESINGILQLILETSNEALRQDAIIILIKGAESESNHKLYIDALAQGFLGNRDFVQWWLASLCEHCFDNFDNKVANSEVLEFIDNNIESFQDTFYKRKFKKLVSIKDSYFAQITSLLQFEYKGKITESLLLHSVSVLGVQDEISLDEYEFYAYVICNSLDSDKKLSQIAGFLKKNSDIFPKNNLIHLFNNILEINWDSYGKPDSVTLTKKQAKGYKLTIDTSIYDEEFYSKEFIVSLIAVIPNFYKDYKYLKLNKEKVLPVLITDMLINKNKESFEIFNKIMAQFKIDPGIFFKLEDNEEITGDWYKYLDPQAFLPSLITKAIKCMKEVEKEIPLGVKKLVQDFGIKMFFRYQSKDLISMLKNYEGAANQDSEEVLVLVSYEDENNSLQELFLNKDSYINQFFKDMTYKVKLYEIPEIENFYEFKYKKSKYNKAIFVGHCSDYRDNEALEPEKHNNYLTLNKMNNCFYSLFDKEFIILFYFCYSNSFLNCYIQNKKDYNLKSKGRKGSIITAKGEISEDDVKYKGGFEFEVQGRTNPIKKISF